MRDPLAPGQVGYLYLFRSNGSLDPSAGEEYVNYDFDLLSGAYKRPTTPPAGPNPENSTVHSPYFDQHFSDRWIDDQLRLLAGRASGATSSTATRTCSLPAMRDEAKTPSRPQRAPS